MGGFAHANLSSVMHLFLLFYMQIAAVSVSGMPACSFNGEIPVHTFNQCICAWAEVYRGGAVADKGRAVMEVGTS